jgi:SpoVK/Ycf46/Vps4 family AAA+-type ATPase
MGFDKIDFVNIPEKDIDSIDDLIEMGYQYHCKKRKIYKGIDMKRLYNLIEPLTELKSLIGMKSVKESMVDQILFFLQKLNKKEKCNMCVNCQNNIKCNEVKAENDDMLHTIITGPPGVGKTELGKILGKVYKSMGILSKGHFMVAKRPDLIAKYLGQTAPKTQAFIDKCKGGVMFIDEAYSLGNPEARDSFSKECLDTINQNLTERRDFLCIIAGYEDSLESSFFSFNEGLKRRFSFKYVIDKYTGPELMEIFLIKIKKEDWAFIGDKDDLEKFFKKNVESFPRFGGDVETLFLKVKIQHSRRVMFKDENLRKKITMDDVNKGFEKFHSHRKTKDELPEKIMTMYT